jgi:hypothetical protein
MYYGKPKTGKTPWCHECMHITTNEAKGIPPCGKCCALQGSGRDMNYFLPGDYPARTLALMKACQA